MTSRIAVLGLGAMGSRLAANYAAAGHPVTIWNRTRTTAEQLVSSLPDAPVTVADAPRAAAEGADVIVSMVRDDDAAATVWLDPEDGALASAAAGTLAIESSTLTPDTVKRIGAEVTGAGLRFVEAPVIGSRPQAEAGALFYLLAGDDADIDAAQPVVDINAGNSTRVGPIGNAATMKLAINGLFATQVAAYAEVIGMLGSSDVDTETAIRTLAALPITSPALQRILSLIDQRDYAPNFPVHLVAKDLHYFVDTAAGTNSPTPLLETAKTVFAAGAEGPERDLDIAGIAHRYQN